MENLKKDFRIDKLLKDRGDSLRKIKQFQRQKTKCEPDRGDSVRNKPSEKTYQSEKKSEIKRDYVKHDPSTRHSESVKEVKILDRRIRDKYTVKNNILSDVNKNVNNKDLVHDSKKDFLPNTQKHTEAKDRMDVIKYTKEKPRKVPVIRTITSKKDGKVYKAVTFATPKINSVTPLQINIPTATMRNQNKITTTSKTSVKPDSERKIIFERKIKRLHKNHILSPILRKNGDSPPTEVAKWVPNCINKHTEPYYEAWVSTTLAAISKNTKNTKFIDERNPFCTFGRDLERIESPELVYTDYKDERYTGKIKINHR